MVHFKLWTVASVLVAGFRAVAGTSFNVSYTGLNPENGVFVNSTSQVYFSSLTQAAVVRYNPWTGAYHTIRIPGITNNSTFHISGITQDKSTGRIWALANAAAAFDTLGGNLKGPTTLIEIDLNDTIISKVDLTPVQALAQASNGGIAVGGYQDLVTDLSGNVYVVATFGNFIARVDGKTHQTSLFWAQNSPQADKYGFSGIDLYANRYLLIFNSITGHLARFDITNANGAVLSVSNYTPQTYQTGDAVRLVNGGKTLLISDDTTAQILVFTSADGWNTARKVGNINTAVSGGTPTFTFALRDLVFVGFSFFNGNEGTTRERFPQIDITNQLKALLA